MKIIFGTLLILLASSQVIRNQPFAARPAVEFGTGFAAPIRTAPA